MEEPRSLLEWLFDGLAAIGMLWLAVGVFAREPMDSLSAIIWWVIPAALFVGGVLGSQWYKKKRLAALIRGNRK